MQIALTTLAAMAAATQVAGAVAATPQELAASHAWVAEKILGEGVAEGPAGLIVLANNDPVQPNERNGGKLRSSTRSSTVACSAMR